MKYIYGLILIATSTVLHSEEILTSIKPIQLLTAEITHGVEGKEPQLLVNVNASPHNYSLKPSDIKRLANAELFIWYGNDLEPFLTKVVDEKDQKVIRIDQIEELEKREYEAEMDSHSHSHEGHSHGHYDPHFWLGPKQGLTVAKAIANRLSEIDPENKAIYLANLNKFEKELTEEIVNIRERLASDKNRGYYVFHDAYGYFEEEFSLMKTGHFTVNPEQATGAKTLMEIRTKLQSGEASCIFTEVQFSPATVEAVTRDIEVELIEIDPLGVDVEVKQGGYIEFIKDISASFEKC